MIDIIKIEIIPGEWIIGEVVVKYYDLTFYCSICLYQDKSIWIKMPSSWITGKVRKNVVQWAEKAKSDEFQKKILSKLFEMIQLDLAKALEIRKTFLDSKNASKADKNR
jgi:hypothetical protein